MIGLFGMGILAWTQGNFDKLSTPYDPDGKGCGVDYPDYPYIYFASPHPDVFSCLNLVSVGNSLCKNLS